MSWEGILITCFLFISKPWEKLWASSWARRAKSMKRWDSHLWEGLFSLFESVSSKGSYLRDFRLLELAFLLLREPLLKRIASGLWIKAFLELLAVLSSLLFFFFKDALFLPSCSSSLLRDRSRLSVLDTAIFLDLERELFLRSLLTSFLGGGTISD